jgi:hypothetical protein
MAEPTDADRDLARALASAAWSYQAARDFDGAVRHIAAALAEERERTQAPFLALAKHYADLCLNDMNGIRRTLHRSVSDRIYRAAGGESAS